MIPPPLGRAAAALLFGTVALATGPAARATEGGFLAGPVGGTDIRAALLPPPGTYGLMVPIAGRLRDFRGRDGGPGPVEFSGDFLAGALGVAHVLQPEVLGGRFYAAAVGTAARGCGTVRPRGAEGVPSRSECQAGLADPVVEAGWGRSFGTLGLGGYPAAEDPRRAWIPYGLSMTVGLGATLPWGEYSTRDLAPPGRNTLVLWPNARITWTSPPWLGDGTEISASGFFLIPSRNPTTDYQSGRMVVVDWAVSERFGRWQAGLAGAVARQVENDRIAVPGGGRAEGPSTSVTAIGPVVGVNLPEIRAFASLKALSEVEASWRVRQDRLTLRIGFAF